MINFILAPNETLNIMLTWRFWQLSIVPEEVRASGPYSAGNEAIECEKADP